VKGVGEVHAKCGHYEFCTLQMAGHYDFLKES